MVDSSLPQRAPADQNAETIHPQKEFKRAEKSDRREGSDARCYRRTSERAAIEHAPGSGWEAVGVRVSARDFRGSG